MAANKMENVESRIEKLEELLKHFAAGIIEPPAVRNGTTKEDGIHLSISKTDSQTQVKPRTMSIDCFEKSPTHSVTGQNGEHLSKDVDSHDTADNETSSTTAVPEASIEQEKKSTSKDRVREVYYQWDEDAKDHIDKDVPPQVEVKKSDTNVERAFTYRKILNREGIMKSSEIEIEDDSLNENIRRMVLQTYPSNFYKTWPKVPWKIRLPFVMVVHCYDKLENFSTPDDSDNEELKMQKSDVRRLLEYVKNTNELAEYFRMRKDSPNTIAFRYLWTLFPPGTEVVARPFFNQWQLFRTDDEPDTLSKDPDSKDPDSLLRSWAVKPWCFDWTGIDWVKSEFEFEIDPYERDKEISALPCYPLKYFKDQTTPELLRAELLKVGNTFKDYCELKGAARMVDYDDLAITVGKTRTGNLFTSDEMSSRSWAPGENVKRPKIKDRVIVDAEAWYLQSTVLYLGDKRPIASWDPEINFNDDQIPRKPDGDWAVFCPPRFFGWALKQKQMAQFKLSSARCISKKDSHPFLKELQLGNDEKDMLLALVEQQESRSKVEKADIVADKGRSLVILLHGPPGVGKTLTAETLAMATGKPLFVVSVADVGLEADGAEAKLEKVFDLASKWDAILLIDEADVFLESRSDLTTPNRNALVSVLLRVLEYYTGTIILTTNRITSLDPAVQSRIHLAIRYDDLNMEQRETVFANFLEKANISEEVQDDLKAWFKNEAARKKLNGREIRNLVSSAQSLAKHQSAKGGLNQKCLRLVLYMTDEFKSQLQEQVAEWKVQNQGRRG